MPGTAELPLTRGEGPFSPCDSPTAEQPQPATSHRGLLRAVAGAVLLAAGLLAYVGLKQSHPASSSRPLQFEELHVIEASEDEPHAGLSALRGHLEGAGLQQEVSQYSSTEWECMRPGTTDVRKEPDADSEILATKPEGTVVVGRRHGGGWLALVHEPGFILITQNGTEALKRRSVSYTRLLNGACADIGRHPIWDAHTCQNAGFALGYFDSSIGVYNGKLDRPEGCYEYNGQLWVATNAAHQGKGAIGSRKPICSSNSYPTTTTTTTTETHTTTTVTTSTTTTTTWGYPSLFCIEVVRTHGFEFPLVKRQLESGASIFTCDQFRVFSDGGEVQVVGELHGRVIKTIVIPPIKKKKMALDFKNGVTTNSWLNTETFLQVWDIANKKDGRLLHHDWVVKVDPDAVFFPERLRTRLRPHTIANPNLATFVMNCDKYNPVALYGSLEIFSRMAMKKYLDRQWDCRNSLPWHGWGEDFYMSHCMDHLQVSRLYDFTLIGDARCHYAACDVTSKVVYHDYKNETGWFKCWEMSRRAEGLQ